MADRLIIHDLVAQCRVGVLEAERATPQPIGIDLELAIDAARAAARDDVDEAIDYATLVTVVRTAAERQPYRLIETMAEELAGVILRRFRTSQVVVRVRKRVLAGIGYAAVEVVRGASGARNVANERSVSQRRTAVTGRARRAA